MSNQLLNYDKEKLYKMVLGNYLQYTDKLAQPLKVNKFKGVLK